MTHFSFVKIRTQRSSDSKEKNVDSASAGGQLVWGRSVSAWEEEAGVCEKEDVREIFKIMATFKRPYL